MVSIWIPKQFCDGIVTKLCRRRCELLSLLGPPPCLSPLPPCPTAQPMDAATSPVSRSADPLPRVASSDACGSFCTDGSVGEPESLTAGGHRGSGASGDLNRRLSKDTLNSRHGALGHTCTSQFASNMVWHENSTYIIISMRVFMHVCTCAFCQTAYVMLYGLLSL